MSRADPLDALEAHMAEVDERRGRSSAVKRTMAGWLITFLMIAMVTRTLVNGVL